MQVHDWHDGGSTAFACQLRCSDGRAQDLALVFNPEPQNLPFMLTQGPWELLLDSSGELSPAAQAVGLPLNVPARSLLLLRAL